LQIGNCLISKLNSPKQIIHEAFFVCEMSEFSACPESYLLRICHRPVPSPTLDRARLHLLDWLGCIIAARATPVAGSLSRALGGRGVDPVAVALQVPRTDAQTAALALGALGNVLEMDDLHRGAILHAGDVVCAAALAVAMRQGCSGAALLGAITRGYEAAIRIGLVAASGGYTPFYNSGTCGVFGAAIAAADLKALDEEGMADALGQAGMQAAGVWQCRLEPTFSKQLACAHAARAGVFSAELAAAGFAGPRQILTGPLGFFAGYYPAADQSALTADPAGDWVLHQVSFKPYPACRHTHPAIAAALAVRARTGWEKIARVDVYSYRAALEFCDKVSPETDHEARFSLQHAVATALRKGPPEISGFEGAALSDPDTAALRHKIRLHVGPTLDAAFPAQYGARLTVTLTDGSRHEVACPAAWGDPENPMSCSDLLQKFAANAAHGGLSPETTKTLAATVMDLPRAQDLTDLQESLLSALTPKMEIA
jgi:2-methylcitrate dehydratase PrpD